MTAPGGPDVAALEEKERLCALGIDVVELYADGMAVADMPASMPEALQQLEGVILYTTMLEAIIKIKSGIEPSDLRAASRGNATAWRTRLPAAAPATAPATAPGEEPR